MSRALLNPIPDWLALKGNDQPCATTMKNYDYLSWNVFLSHSSGVLVGECG